MKYKTRFDFNPVSYNCVHKIHNSREKKKNSLNLIINERKFYVFLIQNLYNFYCHLLENEKH